jgi:hypothetical protein
MIERQELHCHNCDKYVQFDLDLSLNGNHVLECPNCGHEHCRVVKNGRITLDRWDSRNGNSAIYVSSLSITYTSVSIDHTTSATCSYTGDLWFNYGATSSNG